ncbi:TPA: site-2 protease family protein [Patescibacteria group bacterium]|nr:site-2 protease family protein [Patescibacteria group bacterium]
MFSQDFLIWIIFAVPSILIASTIHEYFHAWSAYKLGDPTAKAHGRLTLNPLAHIDPIGAIMMVVFRFGWSKPVPINEWNFEHRRRDKALTALAGPVSNFLVAIITAILYKIIGDWYLIRVFLFTFATINLSLAIFNIIPIPPLDGHKIVNGLLPQRLSYYWEMLEKYSWVLILLILIPFSPLSRLISSFINTVLNFFLRILGFL